MELKPGYKRTEVGLIPEEWEVKPLGELGRFKNGINKGKEDFGHGFPFVNLMDVFGIPKISSKTDLGRVNCSSAERKCYELRGGDVLFVRSSVKPEGVRLTTLVPVDLPDTVFSGFLIRYRDNGQLATEFKEYCFWQSGFRSRLVASSTVSANTNINQEALKQLQIAFPPDRNEQRAIAGALGDVDALLGALEKLIAKKRDLKQAAMQQLLTGKKRLPGFSSPSLTFKQTDLGTIPEGWDAGCLGDKTTKVGSGITPTGGEKVYKPEGHPFVRSQNVGWGTLLMDDLAFIDDDTHKTFNATEIETDDVFLNITGASIGRSAVADARVKGGNVNQHVCIIRTNREQLHPRFLNCFLLSNIGQRQIDSFQAGGNRQGLNFGQIRSFRLLVPPTIDEQAAIAAVLGDMDAEIVALEQRLAKTRALKQGMMQELLTGRTRLVERGAV